MKRWFRLSPNYITETVGPDWASHVVCEAKNDADGRLIVSAPDLLRVAQGALGYLRDLPTEWRPDDAWLAPLEAAIKRAGGEA